MTEQQQLRSLKGVKTDLTVLATIHWLETVYPGLNYNQKQLAYWCDLGERTVRDVTERLEAAGVIVRLYGKGRSSYHYEIVGVYVGRFEVLVDFRKVLIPSLEQEND